jgi:hypothetical protein
MPKLALVFVLIALVLPFGVLAAGPVDVPATPLEEIHFDSATVRAFDRSGQYVSSQTHADGSVETQLNGSFQNVTVARMGPGGEIETYCTTNDQDAKNWMARLENHPQTKALRTATVDSTP